MPRLLHHQEPCISGTPFWCPDWRDKPPPQAVILDCKAPSLHLEQRETANIEWKPVLQSKRYVVSSVHVVGGGECDFVSSQLCFREREGANPEFGRRERSLGCHVQSHLPPPLVTSSHQTFTGHTSLLSPALSYTLASRRLSPTTLSVSGIFHHQSTKADGIKNRPFAQNLGIPKSLNFENCASHRDTTNLRYYKA